MATSGSLEKRREKKPESVQFWLAITAGSLLFHALFMFGVSRSVKVSVVEPEAGGAIDVEMVDSSDAQVVAGGEPIVPAAAFKPEPFKSEPIPEPEFSPEPSPEVVQKPEVKEPPIVKPEVKEEKPIVPKPENKPKKQLPKDSKKQSQQSQPTEQRQPPKEPTRSGDPLKPPRPSGIKSVNFGVSSGPVLTSESKAELVGDATLTMPSFPSEPVLPNFPLRQGQSLTVTLSFSINNVTGVMDSPKLPKIPGFDEADEKQLHSAIVDSLIKVKFSPPKINIKGGAPPPESTEWTITLQLTGV